MVGIQAAILEKTGCHVEVMVYGDGALKIQWENMELADPCVAVANTEGLEGTPNEVKLKYLADNDFKNLSGEALKEAISKRIKEKSDNLVGDMASQGTTPRRLTDDRFALRLDQRFRGIRGHQSFLYRDILIILQINAAGAGEDNFYHLRLLVLTSTLTLKIFWYNIIFISKQRIN